VAICLLLLLVALHLLRHHVAAMHSSEPYYVAQAMFSAVTEDLPRFSPRRTLACPLTSGGDLARVGWIWRVCRAIALAGLFLDGRTAIPAASI
jgi:hypothetical protein